MNRPEAPAHEWGSAPELYGPRHDYRESLVTRRIRRFGAGGDALDAGAGAGSMALRLARLGYRVTAVDASPAFVRRLGGVLAAAPGGPHRALPGDLGALPLPGAAVDLAVCGEVLEHLDDDAAGARELARVLRPDGLLVVTVPAGPERFDWVDRWAGHRRRYRPGDLAALLVGAGFRDVRVGGWGFPLTALYHRHVYRPALARRLARARAGDGDAALGSPPAGVRRALRAVLEVDTLFAPLAGGRGMGLIATARRGRGDGAGPAGPP